jgi:hypothetical protein
VLILIALVTVLSASNVTQALTTIHTTDPPTGAKRVLFECRGNEVFFFDEAGLDDRIGAAITAHTGGGKMDIDDVPDLFNVKDVGDATYRVRAELSQGLDFHQGQIVLKKSVNWIYEPRKDVRGFSVDDVGEAGSEYRRQLAELSATGHYLFYIVREDSFEVFMEARKWAREAGLPVGWHPKKSSQRLVFSSAGTLGGDVQSL